MMSSAQQDEVPQRRLASVGPMLDMMCVCEPESTAGETASVVAGLECAASGGRHRPRSAAGIVNAPVFVTPHHDPARVATRPRSPERRLG